MCIENIVKEIISKQLEIKAESLSLNTILSELGADSLDYVELAMAVEDRFNLEIISDENLEKLKTIQDIVTYIKNFS